MKSKLGGYERRVYDPSFTKFIKSNLTGEISESLVYGVLFATSSVILHLLYNSTHEARPADWLVWKWSVH